MGIIDFDKLQLPDSGIYPMQNATYVATRPKQFKCRLVGSGGTIIRYLVGNPDYNTGALETVANCDTAGAENITFEIAGGSYAVTGHGGFHGVNGTVHGGGGFYHLEGNTHKTQLVRWILADTVNGSYAGYCSGKVTNDPAHGIYTSKACAGVELINCEIQKGVVGKFHGLRFHDTEIFRINGGTFTFSPDPNHYTAALRAHDAPVTDKAICEIVGATFKGGNFGFGPLQEEDGGKNIAVPFTLLADGKTKAYHYDQPLIQAEIPKRNYYDAARIPKAIVKDCVFDGLKYGTFKFNAGILGGEISNTKILNCYGSSLILTPFPYMSRPATKLNLDRITGTLANGGAAPKFFSDENGAKNIRVTNSTLGGKPFTH